MASEYVKVDLDTAAMATLAEEFLIAPMRNPRDNSKIRASSAGDCPVKIAHNVLGTPSQPNTAHKEYTFWQGHALGDAATFILIRLGWVKAEPYIDEEGNLNWRGNTEEQVEDELYKGHYDIFTEPLKRIILEKDGKKYERMIVTSYDDPEGKRYLLDFKTMSDKGGLMFPKDEKGNDIIELKTSKAGNDYFKTTGCFFPGEFTKLDGIPKNYWMQLHVYARIKKADGVMLVVMARDAYDKLNYSKPDYLMNFPVKVFTSDSLDESTLEELDEKAKYIYRYTEKGEVPPIPDEYDSEKFPCMCCEKRHACYPDEYELKPGIEKVRPIALDNLQNK